MGAKVYPHPHILPHQCVSAPCHLSGLRCCFSDVSEKHSRLNCHNRSATPRQAFFRKELRGLRSLRGLFWPLAESIHWTGDSVTGIPKRMISSLSRRSSRALAKIHNC
jgi:hypothetical protein